MKKTWEKRMRKLESTLQSRTRPSPVLHYGRVQYLPPGTVGERHIAIIQSEPTPLANVRHCQFEERLGPAPQAHRDLGFTVYLTCEGEPGNSG